jgi:hypothetical protein
MCKMPKSFDVLAIGNEVFIRTVTYHYTGRIVALSATDIVLEDAAWIASSGRWHEALSTGVLSEVEPFVGPVSINRASYVDATIWGFALPRKVA